LVDDEEHPSIRREANVETAVRSVERLLTAGDLAAFPTELPSGTVRYELWEGILQIMSPTGRAHGRVESAIDTLLRTLGEEQEHGQALCGEVGIILQQDPDTVVSADNVFLTNDQLPARCSREDYLETVPALIVEVRSKNDTNTEIQQKVDAYLAAGARAVWVADPQRRSLTIRRAGEPPVELGVNDTLTADGIIPGFAVPVAELFQALD
jgi:Uma2 family endonuclease